MQVRLPHTLADPQGPGLQRDALVVGFRDSRIRLRKRAPCRRCAELIDATPLRARDLHLVWSSKEAFASRTHSARDPDSMTTSCLPAVVLYVLVQAAFSAKEEKRRRGRRALMTPARVDASRGQLQIRQQASHSPATPAANGLPDRPGQGTRRVFLNGTAVDAYFRQFKMDHSRRSTPTTCGSLRFPATPATSSVSASDHREARNAHAWTRSIGHRPRGNPHH